MVLVTGLVGEREAVARMRHGSRRPREQAPLVMLALICKGKQGQRVLEVRDLVMSR